MSGKKKLAKEATDLAKRILDKEPDIRTIKGAELLKKTEGLTEDPFGYSKFAKPLSEMEYTVRMRGNRDPYKSIDPYDLVKQDATIAGHISDRTAAGRDLVNVGGVDLTDPLHQRGGADYQRTTMNAWANRQGAAKGLNRKLNEAAGYEWDKKKKEFVPQAGNPDVDKPVFTTPVFMGASSANSSHMVGVPLIRMIPNLPISKGDKLAFDAMMSERFPGWPGIDNTEEAEKFMYSGKVPGSAISRFIDYASAKKWKGAGFPDTSEIMFSAMDPRLVGVPQGSSGMGFKEFSPGRTPIIKSNDYHPDYPAAIPGKEYAGGFKYQVPSSLMFPDWWKSLKPELRLPENATKAQHTLMTQVPRQKATAEWADPIMEYWEKNPVPWGYADGGEVDDDVNDALRIAKDVGGTTGKNPQVFLTDAQGRQYDAQGKPIAPANPATGQTTSAAVDSPNAVDLERRGVLEAGEPEKYESDVKPLIDYAVTPIDRPGMPSEPDLVNVMKIATQIAAEGQPTESRGAGNLGRRREEAVRSFMGANPEGYASGYTGPFSYNPSEMADYVNTIIDFSPVALGEVAHDIPYEAGRTGDYGAAAVEGGINAALTAPVMGMAGRGIKKGYQYLKQSPALAAGAAGMVGLTAGSGEAEAGPARWFSKAMEVANALPMEKMTGQQALAMLKKAVSPEELRWTGTEKFLTSRPQVSKGELLDHLQKNRLQLNEIKLGGEPPKKINYLNQVDRDILDRYEPKFQEAETAYNAALDRFYPMLGKEGEEAAWTAVQDAKRVRTELELAAIQEMKDRAGEYIPTKYEDYSTPGGEGYAETLYTLGKSKKPRVEQRNRLFYLVDENGETLRNPAGGEYSYYTEGDANRAAGSIYRGSGLYQSSHWNYPDVLAHSRSQTLTYDPPGANRPYRVHNVDETQSDWGQDARKKGTYDPQASKNWERDIKNTKEVIRDLTDKLSMRADEIDQSLGPKPTRWHGEEFTNYHERRQAAMDSDPKIQEMRKQLEDYRLKLMQLDENKPSISGVPSAPYIGSTEGWTDLAIKKQLDKALDSDADYFSWTPGQVHADRYDLSRHIGSVVYDPYYERFKAYDPNGRHLVEEDMRDASRIDEYVGKELADKIRAMSAKRKSDFYEGITLEENPKTGKWDIVKDGKPIILYSQKATDFPSKAYAAEFLDDAFGDTLRDNPIKLEGLDLKTGGEGMIGYYDKVYLKRVQEVIKKATGTKPEIEVIEVQTADGPRKQLSVKLTDEMREKARFSDFNQGGRVTGGNAYDNDSAVDSALALTREY